MNKNSFEDFFVWKRDSYFMHILLSGVPQKINTDIFYKILWIVRPISANVTRGPARPLKHLYVIEKQIG